MIPIETPVQRFQTSPDNLSKHRKLVDSPEFQRALDFAMLDWSMEIAATVSDANSALRAGFALAGAVQFMDRLKTLAETPKPPSPPVQHGINHRA